MFYAPWCEICTEFESQFDEVEDLIGQWHDVLKIDCNVERAACWDGFGIRKYPTFLLFWRGHGYFPFSSI